VKAIEQPVTIKLPTGGTLTDTAAALMASAAAGVLAPGQAAQLIAALGSMAKITEIDELTARIKKLEEQHANAQ
jgi:cellobiose phosphorylase